MILRSLMILSLVVTCGACTAPTSNDLEFTGEIPVDGKLLVRR